MNTVWLTLNVHQDADVGLSHSIENQTGDRLSEEGVVGLGGEHTLPGALQHHAALSPPRFYKQVLLLPENLQLHAGDEHKGVLDKK